MASKLERQLAEAKLAIQNGDKKRARVLLTTLVKTDKNNPEIWVWLSAVVESRKERVYCLQQVLKLDEHNEVARQGLAALGEPEFRQEMQIPIEKQMRDWEKSEGINAISTSRQIFISGVWRPVAAVFGVILVLGLLTLTGFGVKNLLTRPTSQFGVLQTSTQKPTGTTQPHEYLFLNVDTLNSQTPLADLIQLTATPAATSTPYVILNYTQYEYNRSALFAVSNQDWEEVIFNLENLIEEESEAYEAFYYLGEAYRNLAEYQAAQDYYAQTLEIVPDFPPALLGNALAVYASDPAAWQTALTQIELAIELDPEYPDPYIAAATIYLEQGEITSAQSALRTAKRQLPDSAEVYLLTAKTYLADQEPEKAIRELLKSQELDGTILETYKLLGETYFKTGEYARALEPIRITIVYAEQDNTPELWSWLGYCYAHLDMDEEAQAAFSTALMLDEENATASFYQGLFYMDNEKYAEALPFMEQAYQQDRNSYSINLSIAQIHQGAEHCGKSIHFFKRAETFSETDQEFASVYYHRGLCYVELEYTTSAMRDFNALLELPNAAVPMEWRMAANDNIRLIATATQTATPTQTLTPTRTPRYTATQTSTKTATLTKTSSPTATKTPTTTATEISD